MIMNRAIQQLFESQFLDEKGKYTNRILPETIQTVMQNGLFKCFLPASYGGLGLSFAETLDIIETCAYVNGSLGWLIQIGNGGMFFASNFDDQTSLELFSPRGAVIAGSGAPSGTGIKMHNGYRISGIWKYCSGTDHASLFTVTFKDEEKGDILAAILPETNVRKIKTWKAIGLQHTSTDTIQLDSVFVPDQHIFKVTDQKCLREIPVFSIPFGLFARLFFLYTAFGIYERLLVEGKNFLKDKHAHWTEHFPDRLNHCHAILEEGRQTINNMRSEAEQIVTFNLYQKEKEETHVDLQLIQISKQMRNSSHEIYGLLGIEVLDRDHVIAVCYQDLLATTQHYLLLNN